MKMRLGPWLLQARFALKRVGERQPAQAALPQLAALPATQEGVTCVLNGYRRPDNLALILDALKNQTVPPADTLLWFNGWSPQLLPHDRFEGVKVALSTHNFGVWARFAFALNATTRYVCVFDDDTIPGPRWLENCLATMQTHRGVLGTVGVILPGPKGYPFEPTERVGWPHPNALAQPVDFVGHAWFFERDWLSAFFSELPPPGFELVGEDMHLSYTVQKRLGLGTFVPPHPPGDTSLWGSTRGETLGGDENSIWLNTRQQTREKMAAYQQRLVAQGWRILRER